MVDPPTASNAERYTAPLNHSAAVYMNLTLTLTGLHKNPTRLLSRELELELGRGASSNGNRVCSSLVVPLRVSSAAAWTPVPVKEEATERAVGSAA